MINTRHPQASAWRLSAILCRGGIAMPTQYSVVYVDAKAEAQDVLAVPLKTFDDSLSYGAQALHISIEHAG